AAGVIDAALVDVGRHHRPDLVPAQQPCFVIAVALAQKIELCLQLVNMARPGGAEQIARLEVARDVVAPDPLAADGRGLLRHVPEALAVVDGTPAGNLRHARRIAGADLAAVAAGGAPADARRLQHNHGIAALRQVERSRNPGIAAANHTYVRLDR